MPVIRIKSLPLSQDTDIARVLEGVSKEFAEAVAINVDQVYISWEFWPPGHYAHRGRAAGLQEYDSHPVMVDLLTPDSFTQSRIELMLQAVAEAISRRTQVPTDNILVCRIPLASGNVFDEGRIVHWERDN